MFNFFCAVTQQEYIISCIYQSKTLMIHNPCVQHISHQQSCCVGTHLSDCFPLLLCTFLSVSLKHSLCYSSFCFKAAALITLACHVSFAWQLSLRPCAGEYGERWFVLMMGVDEREMTKGRKMMWDRRRGRAVWKNVPDVPQIVAQIKCVQTCLTFQPIINCLEDVLRWILKIVPSIWSSNTC